MEQTARVAPDTPVSNKSGDTLVRVSRGGEATSKKLLGIIF